MLKIVNAKQFSASARLAVERCPVLSRPPEHVRLIHLYIQLTDQLAKRTGATKARPSDRTEVKMTFPD